MDFRLHKNIEINYKTNILMHTKGNQASVMIWFKKADKSSYQRKKLAKLHKICDKQKVTATWAILNFSWSGQL